MPKAQHPKAASFVRKNLFANVMSFAELEARIVVLPDEQSRGNAFEVFAEAYLATYRKHDAATVWPLASVPTHILKQLGFATKDYGVDGVFQTLLGHFDAYQVKFRTNRPALTWRELSTFMGLADSPHIRSRVLITNCDELPSVLNERQGFFCIRGSDLDRLEADDFRAITAWLADAAYQAPKKTPLPHQAEALDKILPAFSEHHRVSAIMACGTGKTLVALWVAEHVAQASSPAGSGGIPATKILILVPSLALLRQILHEWLRETNLPNLAYLCVCSDPTVKDGLDAIATAQSDLDFQVSTDAASVREFLDAPFTGTKIIFSTYQSARVVGKALKPSEAFDLAVFDEAHKTAGREGRNYAFALEDSNLPIRKRLFLTATPRHYNPQKRDKEGDAQLVFSMDRPEVYGAQAYRLTFAEAARRGIICGYKVVISVITSEMLTNELLSGGEVMVQGDAVRARQVANQIALRDAIAKYGLKKIFTFHSTVKSAHSFVSDGPEGVGTHLNGGAGFQPAGSSGIPAASHETAGKGARLTRTQDACATFQTFHVNGTMPTAQREREMRDFRSAARAVMSNARCLTEGVDVPAVDMVAFLSPRRSRVDIVQAIGRAMRRSPGKTTGFVFVPLYVEQAAGESIEQAVNRTQHDEVWAVLQSLQEQDDVLDTLIHELQAERRLTRGFDDSRLRKHVEFLGPALALDELRRAITTQCLDRLARPWDEMVQVLLAFKKKHRHLRVPQKAPAPWTELGLWVDHVRALKRNGHLSTERQAQLDKLGFCWRVDGQTLDDTKGLLNETAFSKASGFTEISDYRKRGLIKPVGFAMANRGLSAFYHMRQIAEMKKRLGITLKSTKGLLNENQFYKVTGLTSIARYRKRGLIKPIGFAMTAAGISAVSGFYHPRQIAELKKKLGITLKSTKGLLNGKQFCEASGLTGIARYRKQGLIKPVGFAIASGRFSPFYHPRQIIQLKKAHGITLKSTKRLLSERQFMKASGLSKIADYRRRGLIKPLGQGLSATKLSHFYHPRQIAELKNELGINLKNTKGLLNEMQFIKASELSRISDYRKQNLIKPLGFALTAGGIGAFYHPRQIAGLKKKLGITLKSTKGLLNEKQFREESGLTGIARYRERGLIRPVGLAMAVSGLSTFYHPRQIAELKTKLGITIKNTNGLLNEHEVRKVSGLTRISDYREAGLIKPVGFAMASTHISAFYHPRQIIQLRHRLASLKSQKAAKAKR